MMDDTAHIQCPYCSEALALYIEPDIQGSFVQDCEVCCRPWQVYVARDEDGGLVVTIDRV